ncbi:MAG: hypothetical protein IPI46_04970 [Bacteroidetes bacterium]|nr:hypothetical protein [Bacteroidota bacterium]
MLRILKQNSLVSLILLILLTAILKARYILHPPDISTLEGFQKGTLFTFTQLSKLYANHPSLYIVLSTIMSLFFSLYINHIMNREKLQSQKSYLPAFSFILFTSFLPILSIFSMVFISSIVLFAALAKTWQLYHNTNARKESFDIGLLVSLAVLFYFPSMLLILLFPIFMLIMRPINLKEMVAYSIGMFIPLYMGIAWIYLQGNLPNWSQVLYFHITLPLKTIPLLTLAITTVTSFSVILYGFYIINSNSTKNAMAVRKKWNVMGIYLGVSVVTGIFSRVFPGITWVMMAIPVSIILSQAFLHNKEKYNTFTFYFLLLTVMAVQWLFKT